MLLLCEKGKCNCNWGTCIAPPTRRPRVHHSVCEQLAHESGTARYWPHDLDHKSYAVTTIPQRHIFVDNYTGCFCDCCGKFVFVVNSEEQMSSRSIYAAAWSPRNWHSRRRHQSSSQQMAQAALLVVLEMVLIDTVLLPQRLWNTGLIWSSCLLRMLNAFDK